MFEEDESQMGDKANTDIAKELSIRSILGNMSGNSFEIIKFSILMNLFNKLSILHGRKKS
jgi:hypothetical protein